MPSGSLLLGDGYIACQGAEVLVSAMCAGPMEKQGENGLERVK
jgi:hypothetical protein